MKFPRNAKILRSPFEMAPFAAVFFLLVILLMLGGLLSVPGIPLRLPVAPNLPGVDQPSVAVAVDAQGRFYYANQMMAEDDLSNHLAQAVQTTRGPLILVIQGDRAVTEDQLVHLALLARQVGIQEALLATLPETAPTRP